MVGLDSVRLGAETYTFFMVTVCSDSAIIYLKALNVDVSFPDSSTGCLENVKLQVKRKENQKYKSCGYLRVKHLYK